LNLRRTKILRAVLAVIGLLLIVWGLGGLFLLVVNVPVQQATPLTLVQYAYFYSDNVLVQQGLMVALGAPLVLLILIIAVVFRPKAQKLHGTTNWATTKDIARAGLLNNKGIILGKKGKRYLQLDGDTFAMVAAPTRSGKGVGIVIPNLLSWHDSVVVLDIKSENFAITSGYRAAHGQAVYLFNPAPITYQTHRYNPLTYISSDPNKRIDDIQKIANYLIPTPAGTDPMWSSEGRDLLFGVIGAVMAIKSLPKTLGEVLRQLKTDKDTAEHLSQLIKDNKDCLSEACAGSLNNFITKANKERSGVKSTVTSALNIFGNPLIDAATSASDFDFRELRQHKMSIYIAIQPNDLERLAPLVNLFIQQLIDQNTQESPARYDNGVLVQGNPKYTHSVLLLLDEFTSIGRIPILEKGIAFIAGYGLRLLTIIQASSQLRSTYGNDVAETMEKNHAARVVFRPETMKEAELISNELGNNTVEQASFSSKQHSTTRTISTSQTKRRLLLAQEIKALKDQHSIIFVGGVPVIMADKIAYYKDQAFKLRYEDVVDVPTLVLPNEPANDFDFEFLVNRLPLHDRDKPLNKQEINQFAALFFEEVYPHCTFDMETLP